MSEDDDDQPTPPPRRIVDVQSSPIIRLLEREVTDEDRALAKRIARVGGEPSLLAARLVHALETREQTSSEQVAEQLGEALKAHDKRLDTAIERLDKVEDGVKEFRTGIRWGKVLASAALALAGGVGGVVVNRMLTGEELKGEQRVKIDHLQEERREDRARDKELADRVLVLERVISKGQP